MSLALMLALALVSEQKTSIAVMDLAGRGVDEAAAGAMTTEVSNTLAQLRVFRVITREDIKRMVQLEQTRQQCSGAADQACMARSEEHTSELQSLRHLVCRLLLEKKK